MKKILLISSLFLIGCGPGHRVEDAELPKGLHDCDVYETKYGTVVRCPETTTNSYRSGKVLVSKTATNTKLPSSVMVDSSNGRITISFGE